MTRFVDVDLATMEYLRSPDGRRVRYIPRLDVIARDVIAYGVRAVWAELPDEKAGRAWIDEGLILLAPRLFESEPYWIRDVWAHELGHCVVGPSDERVRVWQRQRYGEDEPVWLMETG